MGWTSYMVHTPFTQKDKKDELDRIFTSKTEKAEYKVLKSAMVGSTYYGAISYKSDKEETVFAAIVLTEMHNGEFYYKEMEDSSGPYECKCPMSILDLLSPTDNKNAIAWRERVKEYHKNKSENQKAIKKISVNDVYECVTKYDISWGNNYEVKAGGHFYMKYVDWFGKKLFLVAEKNGDTYRTKLLKLTKQKFLSLEKTYVGNYS